MSNLDWTEVVDREFANEPILQHLIRDRRFCGIETNMRHGELVSLTLKISFLSKSEKERRRAQYTGEAEASTPDTPSDE